MKERKSLKGILPLAVTAFVFFACSNSSSDGAGGSGGMVSLGSGGSLATGGVGVTAGSGATSGIGSGGAGAAGMSEGGSTGQGGASGTGTGGTGGSSGTGGSTLFDGGPSAGTGGDSDSGVGSDASDASDAGGTDGTVTPGTLLPGNEPVRSAGCGHDKTLNNGTNATASGREYIIDIPNSYDNNHPYRLIFGLHGASLSGSITAAGDYFGLRSISEGSTIFIALSAIGGIWSDSTDPAYVEEVLELVVADLCIDTTRIMLEGFSQGGALAWVLACSNPGVYRVVIGHSAGSPPGVTRPTTCGPVAYFGSLGLNDVGNNSQATQTDQFAGWNGCTIETLPTAPRGGHVCTDYNGCPEATPVRWCSYDGGHTSSPSDSGQLTSWMPSEVWSFVSQF
jgi:hypothetical protein